MPKSPKFVVLTILDGWGLAASGPGNAIDLAKTPNIDRFFASYPHTELAASGQAVGLPRGEDGNTETGHLNIGAGMIVYQDLERINMAIAEGSFFNNKVLNDAIEHAKSNNSDLHYMGLVGAGGVHSNIHHLYALINLAHKHNVKNLYLHLFTDGRDSPPTSAKSYVSELETVIKREAVGEIATIMGRYWAMDRDQRWDRIQKAYNALVKGEGNTCNSVYEAIDKSYSEGKTDEFISPSIVQKDGKPLALIKDNDAVVFFNFRIDRPRELSKAFLIDDFANASDNLDFDPHDVDYSKKHYPEHSEHKPTFDRGNKLNNLYFATMTEYSKSLVEAGAKVAFPPIPLKSPLGKSVSEAGYAQLRITESEKERFVTFYFNGLKEDRFPQEDRIIIPSPKVPTYDQKPEMSSQDLTTTLLENIKSGKYKLIVVNYPNADMVGHTGNIGPAVRAIEAVDDCVGKIANMVTAYDGLMIITGDHGNAEEMINSETGEIDTEHSTNPVPFIVISKDLLLNKTKLTSGILADIAPTILSVLGIPVPKEMTGRNLLKSLWN